MHFCSHRSTHRLFILCTIYSMASSFSSFPLLFFLILFSIKLCSLIFGAIAVCFSFSREFLFGIARFYFECTNFHRWKVDTGWQKKRRSMEQKLLALYLQMFSIANGANFKWNILCIVVVVLIVGKRVCVCGNSPAWLNLAWFGSTWLGLFFFPLLHFRSFIRFLLHI